MGSKDHPLLSRYEGAAITEYQQVEFGEYTPLLGKPKKRKPGEYQTVVGRTTWIAYAMDKSRTSLEVYKNYADAGVTPGGR